MDALFRAIDLALVSEAWGGRRLDEASNLVKEYCYRAGCVELSIQYDLIIGVALAPAIQHIFVLTENEVVVLTDDLVFVDAISFRFNAEAIAFNHVTNCIVLVVRSVSIPEHSIALIDSHHRIHRRNVKELGLQKPTEKCYDLTVDSNGDVYVLCCRRRHDKKNATFRLTRLDAACRHSCSTESAGTPHLCAHDGAGVVLVPDVKEPVRHLDRDLKLIGTFAFHSPQIILWQRNLVLTDIPYDPAMYVCDASNGRKRSVAFAPFDVDHVYAMSNGAFRFVWNRNDTIRICDPCFIPLPHSMSLVRS